MVEEGVGFGGFGGLTGGGAPEVGGEAGGVVAAKDDFDALEAERAPGFWPAAVVADHHAEDGFGVGGEVWDAEGVEAEVSGEEVAFFELDRMSAMGMEGGERLLGNDRTYLVHGVGIFEWFKVAWEVDLAVLGEDGAGFGVVVDARVEVLAIVGCFAEACV